MTTLKDIGNQVAKVAPLLGGALAGPAGAGIGALIAAALGSDNHSPELLAQLITSPDALVKLKQLELEHQSHLQRLALVAAERQLHDETNDRISARERESALAKAGIQDKTSATLAYTLTLGLFIALAGAFGLSIPQGNQQLVLDIISSITTVWVGAMAYYHGSSMSAHLKALHVHALMGRRE